MGPRALDVVGDRAQQPANGSLSDALAEPAIEHCSSGAERRLVMSGQNEADTVVEQRSFNRKRAGEFGKRSSVPGRPGNGVGRMQIARRRK